MSRKPPRHAHEGDGPPEAEEGPSVTEAPPEKPAAKDKTIPGFILQDKKGGLMEFLPGSPVAALVAEHLRGGKALGFRTVGTRAGEQLRVTSVDGRVLAEILTEADVSA